MEAVVEEILAKAEKYDVITFDVFDTLLIRNLRKPVDLFELYGGKSFKFKRIFSEMLARLKSKKEDICIEDIYRYLKKYDVKDEIELEKQVCRANPPLKQIYDIIKSSGKRICAVSDMYLNRKALAELLMQAGYDIEEKDIFVSSEYGVTKESGKLFEIVSNKIGVEKNNILHIGDSERADILGAKRVGINAIKINKDTWKLRYSTVCSANMILTGFINHRLNYLGTRSECLGYEVLGPLLVSFCQWIKDTKEKNDFNKLFFLARDMNLPYLIYCDLYGKEDVEYASISRKSIKNAGKHPSHFIKYLKQKGCYGNVAVIDTGWRGIIQLLIDYYGKQIDESTQISGLYMGWTSVYKQVIKSGKNGNCFTSNRTMQRKVILYATFLEALLGKAEKKAVDYDEEGNPIFDNNIRKLKNIELVQRGAVQFAQEWKQEGNKHINPRLAFDTLCELCDNPCEEDIEELSQAEFDDITISQLVKFENKKYYRFHLKRWLKDLQLSAWKGAYFKRSFTMYKFVYKAYFLLDSLLLSFVNFVKVKGKDISYFIDFYS